MAATERGPETPASAPFDEDEDLFDFPIIEMTLEGLQERTPGAAVHAHAPAAQPSPAPALPKPPSAAPRTNPLPSGSPPAPAAARGATDAAAGASAKSPAAKAPAAKPAVTKTPEPQPSAPKVAPAPIVADPLDADVASAGEAAPEPVPSGPRFLRTRGVRIALILLIGLNATGFWFLWRTHSTFGAGLDGLRAEIDDAALRLERARRETLERGSASILGPGAGLDAVDALERTALELAANEIRLGEYGAARKRLSRLLVRAERMSPGLRAEIEPRAAYLVAHSYHQEAMSRKGAQR